MDAGTIATAGACTLDKPDNDVDVRRLWALRVAAVLLVLAQIGDVVSTHALLHIGGVETNPLARFLLGAGWLAVAKLGLGAAFAGRVARKRQISWALVCFAWATVGFYLAVVLGNVLTLTLA